MPWLETAPVEERIQFIQDALSDRFTMSELCARYGVSRRIGYKWLSRYEEEGRRGLRDRSRAPHHCPHRIDDELAELICDFRREHPFWGARKLLRVLADRNPRVMRIPVVVRHKERSGGVRDAAGVPASNATFPIYDNFMKRCGCVTALIDPASYARESWPRSHRPFPAAERRAPIPDSGFRPPGGME